MCCPYREWHEGIKTYSNHVPASCWGAYFPGDEPRYICRKDKDVCSDPDGDMPHCCIIQEPTGWLCPECKELGHKVALTRNACGEVSCKNGHAFGQCKDGQPVLEEA